MTSTFTIYERRPVYCQITDAHIGSTIHRTQYTYRSERLAQKVCERVYDAAFRHCCDSSFYVAPTGKPIAPVAAPTWPTIADDEIPF